MLVDVSIHAPVMDANFVGGFCTHGEGFNPRARDGREFDLSHKFICHERFNPRARDGRE